ncbi:MAG: O-sialoglycoprotein endopeptidase [Acidaminococcaceae bacterium]|nr:O-sialoglycoprotein endopeptidase [Acidaminococcaceae bacterium]MDD4722592.1 O-sialoglycoprotein endopeptidase [Acidaminococcaceae bacterium]
MINKQVVLGIDTSCYTTSVAIMDLTGNLLGDFRRILTVKAGGCGLAQSEMVFQHTRNLPELIEQIENIEELQVVAIGVSSRPRPLENSYMPAFLTGFGLARSLAKVLQVPLFALSHQENHLEAGLWSAGGPSASHFLLLHASGGTTDIMSVVRQKEGLILETVGESIDLHAGQFIDRVGVAMGLPFPAGPSLEKLAQEAKAHYELPVAVSKERISFSGPATAALRALAAGVDKAALARGTEIAIGEAFNRSLCNICAQKNIHQVLLVGGVAANKFIRELLITKLAKRNIKVYIPEAKYSGDGAVGTAFYAMHKMRDKNVNG